jgi:TANFOR domain-containing protein
MCTHLHEKFFQLTLHQVWKVILAGLIILYPASGKSQFNGYEFPLNIITAVTPPYSPYFNDYIDNEAKISLTVTNVADSAISFILGGVFTDNVSISITTDINQEPLHVLSLMPGGQFHLTVQNIQDVFSSNQLVYQGITQEEIIQYQQVPDGTYQFCFTAYDPYTKMHLSSPELGCSNPMTILTPGVAMITQPACNSHINSMIPQNVLFSWVPGENSPPGTLYTLKINEKFLGENSNDAMAPNHPSFFETTVMNSFYPYGPADPPLVAGKQYAFALIESDKDRNIIFENNGWSEICEFTYDSTLSVSGLADTSLNWEWSEMCPVSVGSRLHIEEDVVDEKHIKVKTVSDNPDLTGIPLTIEIVGGADLKKCMTVGVKEVGEMPGIGGVPGTECPAVTEFEDMTDHVCLCTIGDIVVVKKEWKNIIKLKVKKPETFNCLGRHKECTFCDKKYVFPIIRWFLVLPAGLKEIKDADGTRHIVDADGNEVAKGSSFGSEFNLVLKRECNFDILVRAIGECCDGTKCRSQKLISVKWAPPVCVCDPQLIIGPIEKYLLNDNIYVCRAELKKSCDKCRCDVQTPVTFEWELRTPNGIKISGLKQKINGVSSSFTFSSSIQEGTLTLKATYNCRDKDKICKTVKCVTIETKRFKIFIPPKKKARQIGQRIPGPICGRIGFGPTPGSVVGVAGAVPPGAEVKVQFPGGVGGWAIAEDDGSFTFSVPIAWIPLSARVWYKQDDGTLSPFCIVDGPAPPDGTGKTGNIACGLIGFGSDYGQVRGLPGAVPGGAHVRVAFTGGVCGWATANNDGSFFFSVSLAWMPLSAKVWFLQEDGDLSPVCIVDGPPPPSGEGQNGDINCDKIGFGTEAVTVIGLSGAVPPRSWVRCSFTGGVDGWIQAGDDGSFRFEINLGWVPLSAKVCFLKADGNLSRICVVNKPI